MMYAFLSVAHCFVTFYKTKYKNVFIMYIYKHNIYNDVLCLLTENRSGAYSTTNYISATILDRISAAALLLVSKYTICCSCATNLINDE